MYNQAKRTYMNLPITEEIVDKPDLTKAKGLLAPKRDVRDKTMERKDDAMMRVARYVQNIREQRRKLKDGKDT
mgnify:FL=1|jgi:hypothetical protein